MNFFEGCFFRFYGIDKGRKRDLPFFTCLLLCDFVEKQRVVEGGDIRARVDNTGILKFKALAIGGAIFIPDAQGICPQFREADLHQPITMAEEIKIVRAPAVAKIISGIIGVNVSNIQNAQGGAIFKKIDQ